MLGREEVVTVEEAMRIFSENFEIPPLRKEEVHIEDALSRILAEDIISPEDLPNFPRSTVDGYAVSARDTFGATESLPACLNLSGEILMGEEPEMALKKGEAVRIATGGMLPEGADAIVMFEHSSLIEDGMIEVVKAVAPGENVIQIGEDVEKGRVIIEKGQKIRPQDMGALGGIGITKVVVYQMPKVAIISTGDEIVPAERKPEIGQVRDINSYNLSGLVRLNGGIPLRKGIFKDKYEDIYAVVKESIEEADIIAITGGSSVGTRDVTERVINDLGRPGVLVHGVSLKPGKPMILGAVNNRPIFGLPGHPAASTICFEIFIKPVMKILRGERDRVATHRSIKAKMIKNIASQPGREDHIRVAIEEKDGELWARPILGKSGLITTLVKASGIVVIPLNKLGIEVGEEVDIRVFD